MNARSKVVMSMHRSEALRVIRGCCCSVTAIALLVSLLAACGDDDTRTADATPPIRVDSAVGPDARPVDDAGARDAAVPEVDAAMPDAATDAALRDAAIEDAGEEPDDARADSSADGCAPSCVGRDCGDDGCGGSCGTCLPEATCGAGGRCTCDRATCGDDVCGRSACGADCGDCPIGEACFFAECTGATCPGTPCTDLAGEQVCEGTEGIFRCSTDPDAVAVCTCGGGGGEVACAACFTPASTAARGALCASDSECADGVACHPFLHRCGELCSAAGGEPCPAGTACVVPGDVTGICLSPCDCRAPACPAGYECITSLGGGDSGGCAPERSIGGRVCP